MINQKKVLAVVPARGGSKGIPHKNFHPLSGKPLIEWTFIEAKKSTYIDRLIVSTDDDDIALIASDCHVESPFKREAALAKDDTPTIDVLLDVLNKIPGYDYIVLLQPTSPLRTVHDIDACIELCEDSSVPACVSVTSAKAHPYWMYYFHQKNLIPYIEKASNISRRQDLPPVFQLNGAVYVAQTNWLIENKSFMSRETVGYCMPKQRSVDIDDELDLQFAEILLQKRG